MIGALVGAVLAASCSSDDGGNATPAEDAPADVTTTTTESGEESVSNPYEGYESALYAGPENWLCRPDTEDVCDGDLDATVVAADGTVEIEPHEVAEDPPVDCFYVYPTVSSDPGPLADLDEGDEEERAVLNQAARFSSMCRVFAPVYRQITVGGLGGVASEEDREIAYGDVLDAWKAYVADDNDGRGVVLIGHSQGTGHLRRLMAEEIDGNPELQDRLVSALLLGSTVAVPEDEEVGGDFEEIPACTEDGQVGCVVSYATYRATDPPEENAFFGDADGDDRALCTNPGDLSGGPVVLTPYFASTTPVFAPDATDVPEITTEWVTFPDFLSAECVTDGDFDYLELTIDADPADPRTDDISGDLTPEWGLHIVDANVAMGDLLDLVSAQIETYQAD
ncbi:MAG: DUF3089 domain-containing protein [Actinomycetota bacterium]